jgi:6-phosphofructokinase
MTPKNAFYAQSGGVTAVINASACGVLQTAREHPREIGNVYAGRNGIIGALTEDLIDTSVESDAAIAALKHTPGAAFGSCRYKLKSIHEHREQYERLIEVFRAHDVGFFFYNGGGDSQDTAYKVSQMCTELSYAMVWMGRHAGWTTAACALAAEHEGGAPHVLLLPEVVFNEERFLAKVRASVERYGHCVLAVSEGVKGPDGAFLSASRSKDAFGHTQLGGVAPIIADLITGKLGFKCHWAVADYLQRSARHKLPRRMSSKPTQWVVRRSNSPLTEGVRSCRPSAGLTTRPIAGRSSRCRSVKLPTRKNCSLQTSSVPMASASPKRPVVI